MPVSKVTFEPATFADLPGWADYDHLTALKTFLMSCGRVMKSAKAGVPQSPTAALARACRAAIVIGTPRAKLRANSSKRTSFHTASCSQPHPAC